MLSLFVSYDEISTIQQIIDSQYRLGELVAVKELSDVGESSETNYFVVRNKLLHLPLDWANEAPPLLLPFQMEANPEVILAVVYTYLSNFEKAYECAATHPSLLHAIDTLNCIRHGVAIGLPAPPETFSSAQEEYRFWHNAAVVGHYANLTQFLHAGVVRRYYERAFDLAPNDELKAFTGKQWATFLLDADELAEAESLLTACIAFAISDDATYELKNLLYGVWMKNLSAPYDPLLLARIKEMLWEVLNYYEQKNYPIQTALLMIDASQIANISDSFAESLKYINRAIEILEQENIPELVASAQYRKGTLLYTWAQNGNPQFYRPAMQAYQQALRIFTKENSPDVFAEIQHHLGVIYSEIPDDIQKKSVWAGVSVSSFREALKFFTRETHPYEYARICNNFANALTKFPEAKLADNYQKALDYYREALEIRNADEYPFERALTILNFLEAAWLVSVPDAEQQQALFAEMVERASEVSRLVTDQNLIAEADNHLLKLKELRAVLS